MSVVSIINELSSTTSRNEKKEILKRNVDNAVLKKILFYTYNQQLDYYVTNLPELPTGDKTIEDTINQLEKLLLDLNDRKITGGVAVDTIVDYVTQLDEKNQKIAYQIFNRKFTKAGINVKTINAVFGEDFIPEFKIQLANKYGIDKKAKYGADFIATPKLDGIRCMYIKNKGLFTRAGKRIVILPQIEANCEDACERYELEFIDGELWSDELSFDFIQSAVMSNKNLKEELKSKISLNVFAVGDAKDAIKMMEIIDDIHMDYDFLNGLDWRIIPNNIEAIALQTIKYIEQGFEGCMLRDIIHSYSWKRDDNLLKVKTFQLAEMLPYLKDEEIKEKINKLIEHLVLDDFTIVEVIEGKGNFKGMLGAIRVKGRIKDKDIETKVGSGFTLEQRKLYWGMRDRLIGKEVEIVCQEITKAGSLRFPVIKAIKFDR